MVGGLVTSFAMELLVYPAIYFLWKKKELRKEANVVILGPGAAVGVTL